MRLKAFVLRPASVSMIPCASPLSSHSAIMESQRGSARKRNPGNAPGSALFAVRSSSGVLPSQTVITENSNDHSNGRPLWIDTDVGFDDLVAIGCCHGKHIAIPSHEEESSPSSLSSFPSSSSENEILGGISTVGGGLTPDPFHGVAILRGLLPKSFETAPGLGNAPMTIVAGRCGRRKAHPPTRTTPARNDDDQNVDGRNVDNDAPWLAKCREQMRNFCASEGIILVPRSDTDDGRNGMDREALGGNADDEATAVIRSTATMDLVCLGPLTNLAHWLEVIPEFDQRRLNSVWILGGNIPVRGANGRNDGDTDTDTATAGAEFNFSRDPEAVRTVFHHPGLRGTTIHVVPQEVCDRSAFEKSFRRDGDRNPAQSPSTPSASTIIEDWLQSPPPRSQSQSQAQFGDATTDVRNLSSMLPTWMLKLIRTRTYSVYGDPICMYVRDHTHEFNSNRDGTTTNANSSGQRPRIRWMNYSTKYNNGKSLELVTVDPSGRLIVQEAAAYTKSETGSSSKAPQYHNDKANHDSEDPSGVTIRVAREVELGPMYLDWLARSLLPPT